MFKLVYFALVALAAVALVEGAAILRSTPPSGWSPEVHENYSDYHARSLAIGCQNKHNTQFFDDCCHPMKKGETLEKDRKPYCCPGNNPSSTPATFSSSPPPVNVAEPPSSTPQPTSSPDGDYGDNGDDDDDEDDEDCEEDPEYSTDVPPSTPTPTPVPSESPNPTPAPNPTPTPSPSPSPAQPSSNSPEPSPTTGGGSDVHTGGHATWFTQNGVAGACGTVHSDDDFIAALDYRSYGDLGAQSKYCGQKIRVSWQGKSVDVIVADACPTCFNAASVDLSKAAFGALADLSVGELQDITWEAI